MRVRFLTNVLALIALCCVVTPALAEDGFYAAAGASYYAVDLPDYRPLVYMDAGGINRVDSRHVHDGVADGALGELTLGWRSGKAFFEARGFTSSPESTEDRTLSNPGVTFGLASLDGTGYTPFPSAWATSAKLEVSQYGGELLAGCELPLAENLSVSPFVGYFVMELDQDYSLSTYAVGNPALAFHRSEGLNATYNGLETGARLAWTGELLRARLAGTLGWAHVRSEYHGSERGIYNDSLKLHRDDWGGRARLEGGVDLLLGAWTLGLDAGAEYLSFVPGIQSSDTYEPTSIRSAESVSGKLGLNLGYAF